MAHGTPPESARRYKSEQNSESTLAWDLLLLLRIKIEKAAEKLAVCQAEFAAASAAEF